ncbi:MAG: hypothetical protein ABEJ23_00710 [Haloarculaceae archaeon]
MGQDIDVPAAPELTNRGRAREQAGVEETGDLEEIRRAELETALAEGAWQEAFDEWAAYTDLTGAEIATLAELGVFQAFDFFWDPDAEGLDVETPRIDPGSPTAEQVAAVEGSSADLLTDELADLGRTVVEELEDAYPLWTTEETDYVWSEATFGQARDEPERDEE